MRQREIPRWQRNKFAPAAQPVVMSGRQARKLARRGMTIYPPGVQPVISTVPGSHLQRVSGGFRFRRHLIPFAWGAVMAMTGFPLPPGAAVIAGIAVGVLAAVAWRHLLAAAVSAAVIPLMSAEQMAKPWPIVYLAAWLAVTVPWVRRHSWRPSPAAEPVSSDMELWNRHLAVRRLKDSWLADREPLPHGRRWTVMLPPGELEPRNVMTSHALIAGVWDKPMTEVFPEPYPDGRQSRCLLTILDRDTLATTCEWDGTGVGADGLASVGRFADGMPARVRLFVRRDGTKHGLLAGTTGAGKSYMLDLLIRIALACPWPIVPVVLDPQEGQSLPQWRDKVLYAAGVDECAAMLAGLHAGMMDRSRHLGSVEWEDDGHPVRGMDFYDPELSGVPIVMPIIDEAPILLNDSQHGRAAISHLAVMSKLLRKAGGSLWLVAQVPLIAELGDQVIRSMLRGGNVISMRTGDRVSAGALGLEADPSTLPHYFADGSSTAGLGYLLGPDQRQAPFRADLVPAKFRHAKVAVPTLDDRFANAMANAMNRQQRSHSLHVVTSEPEPQPVDDSPEGRKAADAVWHVLTHPKPGEPERPELERGAIINRCAALVTRESWGRKEPFGMRAIADALSDLTARHRVTKVRHGIYQAANAADDATEAGG
jgi:hypothetical protein